MKKLVISIKIGQMNEIENTLKYIYEYIKIYSKQLIADIQKYSYIF